MARSSDKFASSYLEDLFKKEAMVQLSTEVDGKNMFFVLQADEKGVDPARLKASLPPDAKVIEPDPGASVAVYQIRLNEDSLKNFVERKRAEAKKQQRAALPHGDYLEALFKSDMIMSGEKKDNNLVYWVNGVAAEDLQRIKSGLPAGVDVLPVGSKLYQFKIDIDALTAFVKKSSELSGPPGGPGLEEDRKKEPEAPLINDINLLIPLIEQRLQKNQDYLNRGHSEYMQNEYKKEIAYYEKLRTLFTDFKESPKVSVALIEAVQALEPKVKWEEDDRIRKAIANIINIGGQMLLAAPPLEPVAVVDRKEPAVESKLPPLPEDVSIVKPPQAASSPATESHAASLDDKKREKKSDGIPVPPEKQATFSADLKVARNQISKTNSIFLKMSGLSQKMADQYKNQIDKNRAWTRYLQELLDTQTIQADTPEKLAVIASRVEANTDAARALINIIKIVEEVLPKTLVESQAPATEPVGERKFPPPQAVSPPATESHPPAPSGSSHVGVDEKKEPVAPEARLFTPAEPAKVLSSDEIYELLNRTNKKNFLPAGRSPEDAIDAFIDANSGKAIDTYFLRVSESEENRGKLVITTVKIDAEGNIKDKDREDIRLDVSKKDGKIQLKDSKGKVHESVSECLKHWGKSSYEPMLNEPILKAPRAHYR
ncbi:MAG: hypothetical protein ACYCQI_13880 [Gammaproteobacteria bacterium]